MYAIDLCDENGTAVEPGFGGGRYESQVQIPVPSVGDTVQGGRWTVIKRDFHYKPSDAASGTDTLVVLVCRAVL